MPLSPEDVASIQEMINTGLMPAVEKMVDEKVTTGLSGIASTIQGIIGTQAKEEDGQQQPTGQMATLAALAPIVTAILPMFIKGGGQPADPMAQFNQMAGMMRTASEVMLAPVMDIWRQGMSFGVNAVSVAQRASGPLPDPKAFDTLIAPQSQNGDLGAVADFDYDSQAARIAKEIGEKDYRK